jgi:hypothetical protein
MAGGYIQFNGWDCRGGGDRNPRPWMCTKTHHNHSKEVICTTLKEKIQNNFPHMSEANETLGAYDVHNGNGIAWETLCLFHRMGSEVNFNG